MAKKLTEEQKQFIDKNILHLTLKEMGAELNVSTETVRGMIKAIYGDRKMCDIRNEKRDEICRSIEDNQYTIKEIRSLLGVTEAWATLYIQKHNIKYIRKKITRAEAANLKDFFYKTVDDELDLTKETYEKWFRRWFHMYRDGTIQEVTRQFYYLVWSHIQRSELGYSLLKDINRADVQKYVNEFGTSALLMSFSRLYPNSER